MTGGGVAGDAMTGVAGDAMTGGGVVGDAMTGVAGDAMTGGGVAGDAMTVVALAAAMLLIVPMVWRRGARRRLDRLRRIGLPGRARAGAKAPVVGRWGIGLAAGTAVAGLIWAWWGVPVGLAAGVAVERCLARQEPAAQRRERLAVLADLPLGADLLAAALRAGAPIDRAAAAVADALGGPLGERLLRTARSLRLGAEPSEAWQHLAGIEGADRLITAAVRSSASGGALAAALGRLADDLRADRAVAVEAAAQRAGVLIVLPLGLCFLPAFLLVGVVPVLIGLLGDVF